MDGEGTVSTNPLSHDARHADGSVLPSTLSPLPRLHGCWIARGIESRAWIKERSILCPTSSVQWEWEQPFELHIARACLGWADVRWRFSLWFSMRFSMLLVLYATAAVAQAEDIVSGGR